MAVIVNDMSEVNIDAQLVAGGPRGAATPRLSRTEEKLVEMSNGCICCTLREDLLEEVARLDTLVTVVDAKNFITDYCSRDELRDRGIGLDEEDARDIVQLLVDQVEFANVIVISKVDLVSADDLACLRAILAKLNPEARLIEAGHGRVPLGELLDTGLFDMNHAASHPGWLAEAPGTHVPETEEYGISSVVLRSPRPLKPGRGLKSQLMHLLVSGWSSSGRIPFWASALTEPVVTASRPPGVSAGPTRRPGAGSAT